MSRHRHRIVLLALCCLLASSAAAYAATPITTAIKSSTPLAPASVTTINTTVTGEVTALAGQNPQATPAARQALQSLIDDADTPGGGASSDYQKQYVDTVAKALTPMLAGQNKQDQHNAAIIVGGIAARVDRTNAADQLAPLVKTMLASPDPLVSYWGMKTAKYALADSINNTGKDGGLGKLMIAGVQKGDPAGVLADEAYQGLTLDFKAGAAALHANAVLPLVLELLEWRISLYKVAPPPNPQAEKTATNFLAVPAWSTLAAAPQQRDRAMKDIGELGCSQLKALGNGYEYELGEAAQATGSSIGALALHLDNDPNLRAASDVFKNVSPNMDTTKVGGWCDTVKAGFKKHNIDISTD